MPGRTKKKRTVPAPFVGKLFELVEDPTTDEVIHWYIPPKGPAPDGTPNCFVIESFEAFTERYLSRVSTSTSVCSFVRQLNGYGFSKADPKRAAFSHSDFRKGDPASLLKIERKQSAKQTAKRRAERADDSNNADPNSLSSMLAPDALAMNPVRKQQHFARHTAPMSVLPPQPPAVVAEPVVKVEQDFTQVMLLDALQSMQAVVESVEHTNVLTRTATTVTASMAAQQQLVARITAIMHTFAQKQLPGLYLSPTLPSLPLVLSHLASIASYDKTPTPRGVPPPIIPPAVPMHSQATAPMVSQAMPPMLSQALPVASHVTPPAVSQVMAAMVSQAMAPTVSQAMAPTVSQAMAPTVSQAMAPMMSQAVAPLPAASLAVAPAQPVAHTISPMPGVMITPPLAPTSRSTAPMSSAALAVHQQLQALAVPQVPASVGGLYGTTSPSVASIAPMPHPASALPPAMPMSTGLTPTAVSSAATVAPTTPALSPFAGVPGDGKGVLDELTDEWDMLSDDEADMASLAAFGDVDLSMVFEPAGLQPATPIAAAPIVPAAAIDTYPLI